MCFAFADACSDQDEDRGDVGEHVVDLHGDADREVHAHYCESAEDEGAEYGSARVPGGEYDEGDGYPAEPLDGVVYPDSQGRDHGDVHAAESANAAAYAGGKVFVTCNVYSRGVCSCGVFADGAKVEAPACFV